MPKLPTHARVTLMPSVLPHLPTSEFPMSWTTRACPTPSAEATKILSSPRTHPREDGFIPFGDWFPGASQVSGGTVCDCSIAPLCSLPFRREALRHTPSADHVQCFRRSGEWESHTVVFVSLSAQSSRAGRRSCAH